MQMCKLFGPAANKSGEMIARQKFCQKHPRKQEINGPFRRNMRNIRDEMPISIPGAEAACRCENDIHWNDAPSRMVMCHMHVYDVPHA